MLGASMDAPGGAAGVPRGGEETLGDRVELARRVARSVAHIAKAAPE
jgi:hypothetical protein